MEEKEKKKEGWLISQSKSLIGLTPASLSLIGSSVTLYGLPTVGSVLHTDERAGGRTGGRTVGRTVGRLPVCV